MKLSLRTRSDLLVLPDIETPEDRSIERKRLRQNQVLNIVRCHGPVTHSEISRRAGLNLRTVKAHIKELIEVGLVEESEEKEKTLGRPAPLDRIRPDGFCFLGVSFLSTSICHAVIGLDTKVIASGTLAIAADLPAAAKVEKARSFLTESLLPRQATLPPLAGVIATTPDYEFADSNYYGLVFPKAGTKEAALFRMLTSEFQVPIMMENQGRLDAVASLWFGAGRDHHSFAYLGLGEVPRVTFVEDSTIHYGYLGRAGDLSTLHHPSGADHARLLSPAGLLASAAAAGLDPGSLEDLATRARDGEDRAVGVFRDYAHLLAGPTAQMACFLSPQAIILGGQLAEYADLLETPWKESTHALLPEEATLRLEMEPCLLAARSPQLSPAAFGFHHLFNAQRMTLQDIL